ncbi:uncharacterized protein LOC144142065 [Haemaphysalis longicornis]
MANTKDSAHSEKPYIGDWATTDKGIQAFDRCLAALRLDMSITLESFKGAFLPGGDRPLQGDSGEQQYFQCLDVGCGPGSFTLEHLLPSLPAGFQKLVAVDNSEAMLETARAKCPHDKIVFKGLDITRDDDVTRFIEENGRFQIVFSFGTLHWIQDQCHAVKNIGDLVAPGGECFLIFASSMLLFDIYAGMMKSPVWSKYAEHVEKLIPVTHGMDVQRLRSYIANLVTDASLVPLACEVFTPTLDLKVSAEDMVVFYTTANPIYRLISDKQKEELKKFTRDFVDQLSKTSSGTLLVDLQRLVIHAYKPCK